MYSSNILPEIEEEKQIVNCIRFGWSNLVGEKIIKSAQSIFA